MNGGDPKDAGMTAHPPDPPEELSPRRILGRPMLRSEDRALLTGAARYTDDVPCQGALHGVFVRSPIAHALVRSVDVDAARAMPGVVGVFVADDMGGLRMPPVEDTPETFARQALRGSPAPASRETWPIRSSSARAEPGRSP